MSEVLTSSQAVSRSDGSTAPRVTPSGQLSTSEQREWRSYLNRGLAQNSRSSLSTSPGKAAPQAPQLPGRNAPPPLQQSPSPAIGKSQDQPALSSSEARQMGPKMPRAGQSTPAPAGLAASGRSFPLQPEGLSLKGPKNKVYPIQALDRQVLTNLDPAHGMASAKYSGTMIADLASARFSSTATSVFDGSDESSSQGTPSRADRGIDPNGDFRPMRWMLPWLWQLSQSPVPTGQPIEWEVDLPDGDRLRLQAVQVQGEWELNFSGSSLRLQRWISQHRDELSSRLERIIRKPVSVQIDTRYNLQTIN